MNKTLITIIWIGLSLLLFPLMSDAYMNALDDIDFILIQDIKFRKEKGNCFMDVACIVRNSGKGTLKLKDCKFDLAFAPQDSDEIRLGTVSKDEVSLEKETDVPYTDTNFLFSVKLTNSIHSLHLGIISSEKMSSLIMESEPKLNLHIQGGLHLSIQAKQAWLHQKGVRIDWVLPIPVIRDVLIRAYKIIELASDSGEFPSEEEVEKIFAEEAKKDFETEDDDFFQQEEEPKQKDDS